jgi:hypothetical protein
MRTLLGAYIGVPGDTISQSQLSSFISAMGQVPQLLDCYIDYNQVTWDTWANYCQYIVSNAATDPNTAGATLCVGFPMYLPEVHNTPDQAFRDIASGAHDADIIAGFSAFASRYRSFYIRPGWEMNGDLSSWSVTGSDLGDFIAAFRHIANLAHAFTGATIKVDWSPSADPDNASAVQYQDLYPGDQYVDVICIDQYAGPGFSPDDAAFSSTGFSILTAAQFAVAHNKPLGLDEVGASYNDINFPADIAQAIASVPGVQVDHINIWDDPGGGQDSLYWSDQPATAAAWKQAFDAIAATP